ncbi:zinc finger CCCH domain-containing protein 65-like [Andrographis paniculata]|uniref:zinc finger CCCH domain-containing protein 65-like n=1 Tax=Andrographis paniculata TaxID=175694 RepID=UPI0021E93ED0|nr:zinc finger CCCH domain-containing protein 65-like [Andrographis paniculata]XP_051117064.1 zinc finger CCCH domain-containing protein 65-like [Andrographis paniculata]XP_051117065.1 zinc finger CCCH domain-containing protein 65-like [Andrographis paniculata]XP_051117066.1 zinc finger CCCH domain-containing protein 65-like [Andrographis paniculata]XP_051117067.1 zinc finger CCCH domain-containing protein 65-like [Andrographis paniculata]XP_051117068.1 zinc finger CCCH domain-containing prote
MVQTEPPNLSETAAISFPPHRRRPLVSRTYRTLIGILFHCHSVPLQQQTQVDSGHTESRPVSEENLSINDDKVIFTDLLGPPAHGTDSRNELVQEISTGEHKDNFGLQEVNCDEHTVGSNLDHINLKHDGKQDIAPSSTSRAVDLLTDGNQRGDCAIRSDKEQTIANSMIDIQMGDLGALEQLEVDKDFSVSDFSEIFDSCFDMDMVVHRSDTVSGNQENGMVLEEGTHKKSVLELQLKQMELEKLIYNSGVVELTSCPNTNGEMEEGEISDDFMAIDASFDTLSEDVVLMQGKTVEMETASQAVPGKEEFICDAEVREDMQHEMAVASLDGLVNRDNNCTRMESRTAAAHVQGSSENNVVSDGEAGTRSSGPRVPCVKNGTPSDIILQQNAAESQLSDTIEMNGDMKKKRKKGPLTKEKRAKKKKKERIKRAEKNIKLGVKRLKLPPITKKKKIAYCRHYLQGRCREGEKCKFSHDAVPLTKSKPCGHYARHSCMKGDDCPFDHDLSKYPCNNYATQGFCSRGSDCLFSHEIPANQNLSAAPNTSKPECTSVQRTVLIKEGSTASKLPMPAVKLPSSLENSDCSKIANKHGLFSQKLDTKLFSAENSLHQSIGPASKTTGKVPKGVSFHLNEEISCCESSGIKQGGSTLKTSVGGSETAKGSISADKMNELPERAVLKKPRGLNFLSFSKPPADGSTSEIISGLLSKHNILTGKSVMEDACEGKVTGSFFGSSGTLEDVNCQTNQSSLRIQGAKENINGGGMCVQQNINFSPFDKIHSYGSKKQDTLLSSFGGAALSFIKERQGKSSQLPESTEIPKSSYSSSRTESQSVGPKDADLSSSLKTSFLPNTPSFAVRSTLAFAAKFEPTVKVGSSFGNVGS